MRPSSSTSEPGPRPGGGWTPGLFDGVLAAGPVAAAVSDTAWLRALLDVEAALARASARAGLVPAADAAAIDRTCATLTLDPAALGAAAAASGNPVVPLVQALRAAVAGAAASQVHRGATSQDVLDTAAMLLAARALPLLLADLAGAAAAAAGLARAHRDTPLTGRTLLQPALPTTFGLTAAGWLAGLAESAAALAEVRRTRLAVQLGGAAGTLAALDPAGPAVAAYLAEELGLVAPVLPWHTERTRPAALAGALGTVAGVVAKVAGDVVLLAQAEVGEVTEGHPGGSSTLPHKRNPVAAVAARACAAQAPGLVATLLAAMAQEHQRAAGGWHAEWRPFTELLRTVGSAVHWLRRCLADLRVDPARMAANLQAAGPALLAERLTTVLGVAPGAPLDAAGAHQLVAAAVAAARDTGRPLRDVLQGRAEVAAAVDPATLDRLLDPAGYLGAAGELVDRALAAYAPAPGSGGAAP